jgi:serine phosphatase RsbU (regulator of sigma subunit)
MNINEAEYSDERMVEFLKKYSNENSTEFIKLIVEDVKRFAREVPQSDDITSLFIKKT